MSNCKTYKRYLIRILSNIIMFSEFHKALIIMLVVPICLHLFPDYWLEVLMAYIALLVQQITAFIYIFFYNLCKKIVDLVDQDKLSDSVTLLV